MAEDAEVESTREAATSADRRFAAHTPNTSGQWHWLEDHLTSVAEMAGRFGARLGVGEVCAPLLAGLIESPRLKGLSLL